MNIPTIYFRRHEAKCITNAPHVSPTPSPSSPRQSLLQGSESPARIIGPSGAIKQNPQKRVGRQGEGGGGAARRSNKGPNRETRPQKTRKKLHPSRGARTNPRLGASRGGFRPGERIYQS
ncbi:hypothetical protein GWI33_012288 [Rhynchophorus ferrugineus]|uniref:Uncharacterized protein n=1 Tax=Rhynchophorus ferrugineus TaxID=354439 RepID=A0A834MCJ9_RHYFE|nr:hypothetical protein GWI33_012288 [Rhynchophorus ferrugineus]